MPGATSRCSMAGRYPLRGHAYPPPVLGDAALAELRAGAAPFGVYVHVPWCASRCGYCDFNTYVPRADEPSAFARTAVAEVALMRRVTGDRAADTVFIGGGTPTLLDAADLAAVLAAIPRR